MASSLDTPLARALLESGILAREAIEDAVREQLVHGGSLDTILLEQGVIDELQISAALAKAWGTPPLSVEDHPTLSPAAVALLPRDVALRTRMCPLHLDRAESRSVLHIACAAPVDARALDELRSQTSHELVPHVVPEVRLWEALRAAYGVGVEPRYLALLARIRGRESLLPGNATHPPVPSPTAGDRALLVEAGQWRLADALACLARQDHRDGIAHVATAYARKFLPFSAMLGLRLIHGTAQAIPWSVSREGEGGAPPSKPLVVPNDCVLTGALTVSTPFLGKPPRTGGNAALLDWLGRRPPRTIIVLPVHVVGKPVGVLVADGGFRARDFASLSDLVAFGAQLGPTFEQLLRKRRRQHGSLLPHPTQSLVPQPVPLPIQEPIPPSIPSSIPSSIPPSIPSSIPGPTPSTIPSPTPSPISALVPSTQRADTPSMLPSKPLSTPPPMAPSKRPSPVSPAPAANAGELSDDELIERLGAPQEEIVRSARARLIERGESALPALSARFPGPQRHPELGSDVWSPDAAELGVLVDVVLRIGAAAIPAVLPALDSRDGRERHAAALVCARNPDVRALELLRSRLFDREPRIRRLAVEAVAPFLADERFESVLIASRQRTKSPVRAERPWAVQLLGLFRDVASVPLLINLLAPDVDDLAKPALGALRAITLQDFGVDAARWSRWWRTARRQARVQWLIRGLDSRDATLRALAAAELKALSGEDYDFDDEVPRSARRVAVKAWQAWWKTLRQEARSIHDGG